MRYFAFALLFPLLSSALNPLIPLGMALAQYCLTHDCIGMLQSLTNPGMIQSLEPLRVRIENCKKSEPLRVRVKNPFALSSVRVYVNSKEICRIENNPMPPFINEKTCFFQIEGAKPGTEGLSKAKFVVVAVGEKGSQDEGKGDKREFEVEIEHVRSEQEILCSEEISKAEKLVYDVNSGLEELEKAKNLFLACDFNGAMIYALKAQVKALEVLARKQGLIVVEKEVEKQGFDWKTPLFIILSFISVILAIYLILSFLVRGEGGASSHKEGDEGAGEKG